MWPTVRSRSQDDLHSFGNCGVAGQGRMFEQRPDIGFHAFLTQPANQTDRQQRVTTQFKEMIVAPYPLDVEQFSPESCEGDFDVAHRGFVFAHRQCALIRRRQRLAVEFAVGLSGSASRCTNSAGTM